VKENIDLKSFSNYRIGGPARYFFNPKNLEELKESVQEARRLKSPIFILGSGTNLLISDAGFPGAVIKPELTKLQVTGDKIQVGAGVLMSEVLKVAAERGLAGLEWSGGLPGTVGGAVRGNAGAFAGETKDTIVEVTSIQLTTDNLELITRNNAQAKFGYRTSWYKENNGKEIIIEAIFQLKPGDSKAIGSVMEEKIKYRQDRQPLEYPNIGSIFKNVDLKLVPEKLHTMVAAVVKKDPFPVVPTAFLISEAGLKGVACGGAMVSPKHPNFIVNVMHASAKDVECLIDLVKSSVKDKFGINLEEEIIYVQ